METAMSLFCVVAFIGLILWLAFGKVICAKCDWVREQNLSKGIKLERYSGDDL